MDDQIRLEFDTVRQEMRDGFAMLRKEMTDAFAVERHEAKQDRHDVRDWLQAHVTSEIYAVRTTQEHQQRDIDGMSQLLHKDGGLGMVGRLTIVEQLVAAITKNMDSSTASRWLLAGILVAAGSSVLTVVLWAVDKIWK